MKADSSMIIKKGKIPKNYVKYTCNKCDCVFAKPSWDYEKVNAHPGYGIKIVKFVRCPTCNNHISK